MYRIAICDDEQAEVVKNQELLSDYKKLHPEINFEVGIFKKAKELLLMVQEGYVPDLILMDIYMDGETGIEAAQKLYLMGKRSRVIFLTTSEKHAVEAFKIEAAQYLVKPVSEAEFFQMLDRQLEILDGEKQKYVVLQTDNKTIRVTLRDIVYCESQGKYQHLHLMDGDQISVRMTMSKLEEMFLQYEEIIRIGKWYIINIDHVERLESHAVQMSNGQRLYLPRGAYQLLKRKYITYYMGESYGRTWNVDRNSGQ